LTPDRSPDFSDRTPITAGSDRRTRIILSSLFAAAALVPLFHLLALTAANYYDVPYYDTWSLYYHIAQFINGDMSWGRFLFSQQVDSRPTVPRLLLLLAHCLTRDLGIVVVLNFSAAIASAAMTLMLLRKTNPGISWPTLWAAGAFFNLSFFSIAQWVNWNWHNAIMSFLPNVFFALGWLINTSSFPPVRRGLLVSLCCALSSFSFASGLFQWFVLIPLTVGLGRREKVRVLSLHFVAALICFAFYFTRFKPGKAMDMADGLSHLGRSVRYVFMWLGSSLSGGSLAVAEIWGAALLLTFLVLAFQCFRIWRTEGLQASWLPWLSMGCYPLISGSIAALGRSHIGLEQALRSRYCTYSLWLIIGIIGLTVTLLRQNWQRKGAPSHIAGGLLALLVAAFLCFQARHSVRAAEEWRGFRERVHFQKQSFGLEEKQPGQLWTFDHPHRKQVVNGYKRMRAAGFLRDVFHSGQVLDLITTRTTGRWSDGDLKVAPCLPFREIKCRGWSVGGNRNAGNRVLVVLITPKGKVLAVGEGPINRKRADVLRHTRASSRALAGFDLQLQIPKMAPGVYRLAAFRYGKDERSYYPVGMPQPLTISD
jgi:hypothetical protein